MEHMEHREQGSINVDFSMGLGVPYFAILGGTDVEQAKVFT